MGQRKIRAYNKGVKNKNIGGTKMNLVNCVELVDNNANCVVLKVKPKKEMELICLGCFDGNETMFRLTKGDTQTCTVWRDNGKSFSWDWGRNGCTLVSDKVNKMGNLIQNCIEKDLHISVRR